MSKFDQGKHDFRVDENGAPILSKKRLDAQKPPKKLVERQAAFSVAGARNPGGFHMPGSQNSNK